MQNRTYKKTLLIDLDGVLNQYTGNYNKNTIPPIKEGAKEFLEKLSEHFELKIFTSRSMKITAEWLIENNLSQYISDITNIKVPGYLLIDDRAICYNGNYSETLESIKNFQVHWKS